MRPASSASMWTRTRPGQFRANGSLRNQDRFVDAFGVKPDDAMYLPPEQRVSLWQTERPGVGPDTNR